MSENRFTGITAKDYDLTQLAMPHHDSFQDAVAASLFSFFDSRPDLNCFRVLEIGCGTGETTRRIFQDKRIHVLRAIDISREMVDIAEKRCLDTWKDQSTIYHQVRFHAADALTYLNLPERWNTHAVASCWTLHNVYHEERKQIISAIYGLIDPKGAFVLGDKLAPEDPNEHKRIYDSVDKRCEVFDRIGRPDFKEAWLEHLKKDDLPEYKWTQGELEQTLRDVGFKDVRMTYREEFETVYVAIK